MCSNSESRNNLHVLQSIYATAGIKYCSDTSSCSRIRWMTLSWMISEETRGQCHFLIIMKLVTWHVNNFTVNAESLGNTTRWGCSITYYLFLVWLTAHGLAGVDLLSHEELLQLPDVHPGMSHVLWVPALRWTTILGGVITWRDRKQKVTARNEWITKGERKKRQIC